MELKELYDKTLELFGVEDAGRLGNALMQANDSKKAAFVDMVGGDLTKDWLQMVYQYYLADRKEKKQDYTPASVAKLMGRLAGRPDVCIDLCAGTGALTIQKWAQDPGMEFDLREADKAVIPFLLFNMSVRNIACTVHHEDVLHGEEWHTWKVQKGERFGKIIDLESAV